MGLLSGNRQPFPDCEAVVGLHFSDDALDALSVVAKGDLGMVSHLPPAYFDKILYNARRSGDVGEDLLLRAEAVWQQAADDLTEETVFVSTVPVYAGTKAAPDATVAVKLSAALGTRRIGAETSFSPLTAANPTVAEVRALGAVGLDGRKLGGLGGHQHPHSSHDLAVPRLQRQPAGPP